MEDVEEARQESNTADVYINPDEYKREIEEARQELFALIWSQRCAPLLLKLAFNDAATFEGPKMTGGPNGSIRMEQEYTQSCNQGLKLVIDYCEAIKQMHPMISYADIYQLAGVVAVQATGGPNIDIMFGRKDSEDWTEEGRIPDYTGGAKELRKRFFVFLGLNDQETVALAGAHTLGRVHGGEPRAFDNSYFQELLQGQPVGEQEEELVEVPLDHALVADPFYRKFVDKYAQDKKLFFQHYAIAHKKLAEIAFIPGFPEPPSSEPLIETNVLKKKKKSLTKKLSFLALLESLFLTVLDSCFHGRKSHAHTS